VKWKYQNKNVAADRTLIWHGTVVVVAQYNGKPEKCFYKSTMLAAVFIYIDGRGTQLYLTKYNNYKSAADAEQLKKSSSDFYALSEIVQQGNVTVCSDRRYNQVKRCNHGCI